MKWDKTNRCWTCRDSMGAELELEQCHDIATLAITDQDDYVLCCITRADARYLADLLLQYAETGRVPEGEAE